MVWETALSGCAYEYDEDFASGTSSASAPAFTDAALPRDPALNRPVSGAELDAWAAEVLPEADGEDASTPTTVSWRPGRNGKRPPRNCPRARYALTLACRGPRRVSFNVSHGDLDLVDLNLG